MKYLVLLLLVSCGSKFKPGDCIIKKSMEFTKSETMKVLEVGEYAYKVRILLNVFFTFMPAEGSFPKNDDGEYMKTECIAELEDTNK